jgi:hypothetical protein
MHLGASLYLHNAAEGQQEAQEQQGVSERGVANSFPGKARVPSMTAVLPFGTDVADILIVPCSHLTNRAPAGHARHAYRLCCLGCCCC